MPLYWIDLPVGAQRVLEDAADTYHMRIQHFLGMLLTDAADAVLDADPDRRKFALKRDYGAPVVAEESASKGEPIDAQFPVAPTSSEGPQGSACHALGGRSLVSDTKKRGRGSNPTSAAL